MANVNLNNESNGFLDCISALNWERCGYGGHRRTAFGKVYDYDLKSWKDAYADLCEQHHRHATYQEYIDWMNANKLIADADTSAEIAAYEKYLAEREAEKKMEEHRAALLRTHKAEFENACDDLYFGYGFKRFYPDYSGDLSEADAKIIWKAAFDKVANMD